MAGHDIIVVGASAGGVEALIQLVADLPKDLPAAIFVVVHISAQSKSFLPTILSRQGPLNATHAIDGEVIAHGRIYVAPPDYHLLVKRGYIRLVKGPKENNSRPAVDPLFRTAAKAYGRRVVGVILSGTLDDGTAGLIDVKHFGGVAVVQNPNEAVYKGMPSSAIENVEVDHILPVSSIAAILARLAHEPVVEEGTKTMPSENEMEMKPDVVELDGVALRERGYPGPPSRFTCPDCGGTLFQLNERNLLQFRCRTGHAYSAASLMAQQSEAQEEALWVAMRSLEERGDLMNQMATKAREGNRLISAKRYESLALEAQKRADLIRQALVQSQLPATVEPEAIAQKVENTDIYIDSPLQTGVETQGTLDFPFKVIVLAGSAGGLNALSQILPALPQNFPAAIILVQDLDTQSKASFMTDILNQPATLPLKLAQQGERLRPGIIYITPLTEHLLLNPNGTISLSKVVFVDFIRPSADLLFESVAASFKERAIAVVLSGTGNNCALGVQAIKKMGGKTIAQDESTCEFFDMPKAAIQTKAVDFVLPPSAIASTLVNLLND